MALIDQFYLAPAIERLLIMIIITQVHASLNLGEVVINHRNHSISVPADSETVSKEFDKSLANYKYKYK